MADNAVSILQDVRKAIMDGQYAQLAILLPALQHAEADGMPGDLTVLRNLKVEAARTEVCLQSALNGVRAARRRVAEVAEAARGLTTYDREGIRATVPAVAPASRRV